MPNFHNKDIAVLNFFSWYTYLLSLFTRCIKINLYGKRITYLWSVYVKIKNGSVGTHVLVKRPKTKIKTDNTYEDLA